MMFWRRNTRTRNRRKQEGGRKLRLPAINWRRLLPAGAVLAAMGVVVLGVRFAMDQPVERVDITGRFQRVQPVDVQDAVRRALGNQGMVGVDLKAVSMAVKRIPWVDNASVGRSWPRGLNVQVTEQVPVARWGQDGLLNVRGEIFAHDLSHAPAELPLLVGPAGYEAEMTALCLAAQQRLAKAGLRLAQLQRDERGSWEMELDNGVRLRLGHVQVDERFDRFIVAAARIVAVRAAEIRYVDLRYANGFAIGWRSAADEVKRG